LLGVSIPSLTQVTGPGQVSSEENLWKRLTVGFRYILARPGLVAMMFGFSLFALPNDIGRALYPPMILARSGGDAQVLGSVSTAAGIGGVLGAIAVSLWGGTKRRVHGMLMGFVIAGTFKMLLACGHGLMLWAVAHFCATLSAPLFYSCSNAIWYAKVPPALQGRVLAADQMVGLIIGAIAPLLAGSMADDVFEPAMQSGSSFASLLAPIFGTGPGAGMALLYAVMALWIVLVGVGGYAFRTLRQVETILPDHDTVTR
jgi:MFS transporter, DHA3 family, macrolide efflux protein